MTARYMRLMFAVAFIAAMLCLAGCGSTSIADINRDPAKFTGKEITIRGQASDSFGALGKGIFQVEDGTGSIWVFSDNFGVPGNGTTVTVQGQIEQGFSFGGRNFGIILRETKGRS